MHLSSLGHDRLTRDVPIVTDIMCKHYVVFIVHEIVEITSWY